MPLHPAPILRAGVHDPPRNPRLLGVPDVCWQQPDPEHASAYEVVEIERGILLAVLGEDLPLPVPANVRDAAARGTPVYVVGPAPMASKELPPNVHVSTTLYPALASAYDNKVDRAYLIQIEVRGMVDDTLLLRVRVHVLYGEARRFADRAGQDADLCVIPNGDELVTYEPRTIQF